MAASIHPTAVIAPDAALAEDVEVGAFALIGPGVEIGARTRIGPHAVIQGPTRIGVDNQIFQFASVGSAPQDKKYKGEPTGLEIGDRNIIRECVTLNRGTSKDAGVTRIGSDNLFMAYSHVAHDCVVGNQCVLANTAMIGGHVHLGDWVIMGGLSGVHQFCKIGAHAFIANNTTVTRDVPPYVMVAGHPAAAHSVNAEGLKRRGFSPQQIRNLRNAFRVLYRSGLKLADAASQLEALAKEQPEILALVEFLPQSTRSILR
ncbi:MAG TPA: acyl-ACP--UDP-N-acetylglucosamine O-acyltransferase [Steroidobacteraceae bacterium]